MYITCPYCGTKHLEFQSNCKNCGAPLPGPGELAVDAARRKLAMPPAPPREIASSFAWRWLLTDGWSIAAFVFVIVGGSFSLTGVGLIAGIITAIVGIPLLLIGLVFLGGGVGVFYWRYTEAQKALNVLRHGLATRGEITAETATITVRFRRGVDAGLKTARLASELERAPTTEELAARAELTAEEVEALLLTAGGNVSLSAAVGEDGSLELGDTLEQDTIPSVEIEMIRSSFEERIKAMVDELETRERDVIRMRFGLDGEEPRTLQEIGEKLGLSRERVRQIESRAKEKLRRSREAHGLRGYLN